MRKESIKTDEYSSYITYKLDEYLLNFDQIINIVIN